MTRVGTIRVAIRRDDILRYQGTPPRTSQDVASEPRTMQQEWHSTRRTRRGWMRSLMINSSAA